MGMRQRSLLGRRNLHKYEGLVDSIESNISPLLDVSESDKSRISSNMRKVQHVLSSGHVVYAPSTAVMRTIQSAYAELSGLLGLWDGKGSIKHLPMH